MSKSAKEMFEELEYKKRTDENCGYLKADVKPNRINPERIEFKNISFINKKILISSYITDASCMNKEYTDVILDVQELQAINKQVEELGWLDVNTTN